MVRHGLPIVTVILNNLVWGMSIHGQDIMYGRNRRAITELRDTAYDDVTRHSAATPSVSSRSPISDPRWNARLMPDIPRA